MADHERPDTAFDIQEQRRVMVETVAEIDQKMAALATERAEASESFQRGLEAIKGVYEIHGRGVDVDRDIEIAARGPLQVLEAGLATKGEKDCLAVVLGVQDTQFVIRATGFGQERMIFDALDPDLEMYSSESPRA
jgi:hypothetical protein